MVAQAVETARGSAGPDGPPGWSARLVAHAPLKLAAFAVAYYALLAVGRSSMAGGFYLYNVFRPAAGFLLAVLFITEVRLWPVLIVVATAVDWASARAYPTLEHLTLILPLVNSLIVTLNAALMRWLFIGRQKRVDLRELVDFLAVTAMASLLFAIVAAVVFEAFSKRLPVGHFTAWERWQVWAIANLLGILIVTPVVLTILRRPRDRVLLRPAPIVGRWPEFTLLLAAVIGLSLAIFRNEVLGEFSLTDLTYLLVHFMTWIVLRFDLRVAMAIWMGVALLAAWSTQHGQGPFAKLSDSTYEQVLALQIFLCVATLSLLALGVVLNDRRLKEEELALSETRYRAVVEDQTEFIVRTLPDGAVTFVNEAVCRALSRSADDLIGARLPALLRAREGREGASAEHPTVTYEARVKLPGGEVWAQWTDRALFDRDGGLLGYQSVGRDITALKHARDELTRANARLQTLSNQLIKAQEDERRALARELHDEVGQTLTALKIGLQRLRRRLTDAAALGRLDDTDALAEHALQEVRTLSLDLRPSMLDDFGLVAALRWYLDRQADRAGFAATVDADPPDFHADPAVETTCYRVVQEAVTNAIRHARATWVDVLLRADGDRLRLEIRDDGAGFDVPEALARASRSESLGLLGMHERAALAGGVLDVESAAGQGTRVVATFPLNSPAIGPEPTEAAES
ncbi:MAG TPA: MASE1 domain-containing protein [Isosphaeraceae bacterium]|nr:MASE1 domain-containing protein [Isosphaeraceae bacterium]